MGERTTFPMMDKVASEPSLCSTTVHCKLVDGRQIMVPRFLPTCDLCDLLTNLDWAGPGWGSPRRK